MSWKSLSFPMGQISPRAPLASLGPSQAKADSWWDRAVATRNGFVNRFAKPAEWTVKNIGPWVVPFGVPELSGLYLGGKALQFAWKNPVSRRIIEKVINFGKGSLARGLQGIKNVSPWAARKFGISEAEAAYVNRLNAGFKGFSPKRPPLIGPRRPDAADALIARMNAQRKSAYLLKSGRSTKPNVDWKKKLVGDVRGFNRAAATRGRAGTASFDLSRAARDNQALMRYGGPTSPGGGKGKQVLSKANFK